ncbi:Pimeloyl-ACP methyl ester carboxylesterase [Enhydrobacter aerosaccus]|uniref:Pimeloyl-ACP methyl ester carboxylesterase n=1 Tax=Enhydrobacter aerosaccus TaxID=225324 RepID=A0A1T4QLT5_9HYPH|nr:alpha/beta hydrolase [Enhydrobacter aerosaccus]SKA04665.1 Pimeloyl-ACP methyl ester carboxylesterase [Enhydrobacter aerosaccus]
MPLRRRRAEGPRRPWWLVLLFATGVLAGVVFWAYSPDLPKDLLVERYANAHSQFLDVGGARAHVRDEGKADAMPLLLIHGSLGSLQVWEGWVDQLKDRYRLISVDLPGHGLTGPWPRGEYSIEAYTDFIEVLADALHLDRFAIAGQSMGGAVAWSFASTRPERVSQLILVDSAGYPGEGELPFTTRLARLGLIGDIGIYFKPQRMMRRALLETYADPAMVTPERLRRYSDLQRYPGNRQATLQRLRTQEPLDPTPIRRLDVPTLVIWGAKDQQVPVNTAFRLQGDIKGAKLAVFSTLGHAPMEEDPVATAAAVAAFLPTEPPRPLAPPTEATPPSADQPVAPSIVPEKD